MKNLFKTLGIVCFTLSLTGNVFAWSFFNRATQDSEQFKNDRSHYQFISEISVLEYSPTVNFKAQKELLTEQVDQIPGLSIGVAREMRLPGALSWTLGLSTFYNTKKDEDIDRASAELPVAVSELKRETTIYGAQASLSINYLINTSWILVQPFIQGAIGTGIGKTELDYYYDLQSFNELYKGKIEESFTYLKLGLGVNFIAKSGLFSYISVHQNNFSVDRRTSEGSQKANGGTESKFNLEQELSETFKYYSATLGMGYRF